MISANDGAATSRVDLLSQLRLGYKDGNARVNEIAEQVAGIGRLITQQPLTTYTVICEKRLLWESPHHDLV